MRFSGRRSRDSSLSRRSSSSSREDSSPSIQPRISRPPNLPDRPSNPARVIQQGIGSVMGTIYAPIDLLNTGFANATNFIAQALPSFPAAYLSSLAVGVPHIHAHPPSLVPPAPPVPLPAIGPVTLGCYVQVLINGMPAARCGDMGFSPTCGGFAPAFEIFTGSSKVFIGGARAARMTDITKHCMPSASGSVRGAIKAMQMAAKAMMMAGMVAQVDGIVADTMEAVEADSSAVAGALALSASMSAAQMASDAAAMAVGALMGSDPAGSPAMGVIMTGAPNVLIGGFPMPSWMEVAKGLMKLVKGLRARQRNRQGRRSSGSNH